MSDNEFFKQLRSGNLELRGDNGGIIKKQSGKWSVAWYSSRWTMEDLGRVYRKLKELNKE